MRLLDNLLGKKSMKDAQDVPDALEAMSPDPTRSEDAAPDPTTAASDADGLPGEAPAEDRSRVLADAIIEQLRTVFDPEIPVNIYELGLIYDVDVDADGAARIRMTLTTPMCPAAEELPPEVESKARAVEGITSVQLDLVWEPPWSPDRMSESARLELGML